MGVLSYLLYIKWIDIILILTSYNKIIVKLFIASVHMPSELTECNSFGCCCCFSYSQDQSQSLNFNNRPGLIGQVLSINHNRNFSFNMIGAAAKKQHFLTNFNQMSVQIYIKVTQFLWNCFCLQCSTNHLYFISCAEQQHPEPEWRHVLQQSWSKLYTQSSGRH